LTSHSLKLVETTGALNWPSASPVASAVITSPHGNGVAEAPSARMAAMCAGFSSTLMLSPAKSSTDLIRSLLLVIATKPPPSSKVPR
jgi:hypothetical protein